ncbi:MAG TPA: DUF1573 domain-containing protein [Bacteroidales bacterium]|nr:DUF1573 domain-containing protein [Bacteroidales bacterium]
MRKRYLIVLVLFLAAGLFTGCNNSGKEKLPSDIVSNPNSAKGQKEDKQPKITFKKSSHDFGQVIQGEVVSYHFKFENTGTGDLVIADVSSSCGCTVTDFPEGVIKPGETRSLEVTFDSDRRRGFQNKTVTVLTNAQPAETTLKIKAKVVTP